MNKHAQPQDSNGKPEMESAAEEVTEAYRQDCIRRAQRAVDVSTDENPEQTQLVDLLCHLRHWADEHSDVDFDSAFCDSLRHYCDESRSAGRPTTAKHRNARPWNPLGQFDPDQQSEIVRLIDSATWGDIPMDVSSVETALQLAVDATEDALSFWHAYGEERFGDEFSLNEAEVEGLDPTWRLAYVAQLVKSAAGVYGLTKRHSWTSRHHLQIADLLHELIRIAEPPERRFKDLALNYQASQDLE
jgi:hypothetical protein